MAIDTSHLSFALTADPGTVLRQDGVFVPIGDPANADAWVYALWLSRGGVPTPYVAPVVAPTFRARDLLAQMNASDYAAVSAQAASAPAFGLGWHMAISQGEQPINPAAPAFTAWWAAFKSAVGATRAAAIASALKVT